MSATETSLGGPLVLLIDNPVRSLPEVRASWNPERDERPTDSHLRLDWAYMPKYAPDTLALLFELQNNHSERSVGLRLSREPGFNVTFNFCERMAEHPGLFG